MRTKKLFQTGLFALSVVAILFACKPETKVRPIVPPDPNKPTVVTDYYPDSGGVATKILIHGTNFGTDTSYIHVTVNGKKAAVIRSDGECIYAIVPSRADTGFVRVQIGKGDNIQELAPDIDNKFKYRFSENVSLVCGRVGQAGILDDTDSQIGELRRPWCVTTDADGNLFMLDEGRGGDQNGGLRKIINGKIETIMRNSGAAFRSPAALAFNSASDTLFMCQTIYLNSDGMTISDPAVVIFLREEAFQVARGFVRTGAEDRMSGITFHPITNELFVVSSTDGYIYRVDRGKQGVEDKIEKCVSVGTSGTENRVHGISLCFSPDGQYIYAANKDRHCIYRCRYVGGAAATCFEAKTVFAGADGRSGYTNGMGQMAQFNKPGQITCDKEGNVYVADRNNHCIRKITPQGEVSLFAGRPTLEGYVNGTLMQSQFKYPESIWYDNAKDIWYVADCDNELIRKILVE